MTNHQKRFEEILQDFNDAMLTTFGSDGRPSSRPMRIAKITEDSTLWFATSKASDKVEDIQANELVAITMQGGGKYLSLTGKATLIDDPDSIDEMWSEAWKIWFPKGKKDPSITLLKVVAEDGAYWDMSGMNRLRYLYEAGKAYFTGCEIDTEVLGMDGNVNLS